MKFSLPLLVCATALLLAGCGQTGPLHLPDNAPAKEGYLLKKRKAAPTAEGAAAPAPSPGTPDDAPVVTPPANPGIEPR